MRYSGGKFRQSVIIAQEVAKALRPKQLYVEPFAGMMSVPLRLAKAEVDCKMRLSDCSQALITMWRAAVYDGWDPPKSFSFAQYQKLRITRDPHNPVTAFIGFGKSFRAKYFGTYARPAKGKNDPGAYTQESRRALLRDAAILRTVKDLKIGCADYRTVVPRGAVIYLDPPYVDGMHDSPPFDWGEFWAYTDRVRKYNTVFLTLFDDRDVMPGWDKVHDWGDTNAWVNRKQVKRELLFRAAA